MSTQEEVARASAITKDKSDEPAHALSAHEDNTSALCAHAPLSRKEDEEMDTDGEHELDTPAEDTITAAY